MALVAYECSDDSNDDEEDSVEVAIVTEKLSLSDSRNKTTSVTLNSTLSTKLPALTTGRELSLPLKDEDSSDDDSEEFAPLSFAKLPEPNYHALSVDVSKIKNCKSKLLTKLVPATSRPKELVKKSQHTKLVSGKAIGLLSVLPTPINEVTSTLSQVSTSVVPVSKLPAKLLPTAVKNNAAAKEKKAKKSTLDDSDDDEIGVDFFSLSKVDSPGDLPERIDIDFSIGMNDSDNIKPDKPVQLQAASNLLTHAISSSVEDFKGNNSESYDDADAPSQMELDENTIEQLCGRKRRGQIPDDIQLIDIHEDKILAESKKNLAKQLTEETNYRPSAKKHHGPSSLEKRKHQITYLAYQAKERELELKNQWANNRFTKKQTQSKYGF